MDIDTITMVLNAMSYEERGNYLCNRLCFYCKQPGHVSCECPKKRPTNVGNFGAGRLHNGLFARGNQGAFARTNNAFNRKPDAPRKMGPQELNKHIHTLSQEEQEIMFDLAEVEDNDKGPSEKDFS